MQILYVYVIFVCFLTVFNYFLFGHHGKLYISVIESFMTDHIETYEPRCEKTGLRGLRPGPTQAGLYSHRRWLEA